MKTQRNKNLYSGLKSYVNPVGKGLTKKGIKALISLIEMIDFEEIFSVSDLTNEALLKSYATEKQMEKIWEEIEKAYGHKRFREVMEEKYG